MRDGVGLWTPDALPARMTTPPPNLLARLAPSADESVDRLLDDWWILQLRRGHRFSTDDLVCGWCAAAARPDATRLLDLGSGVGSVGLYTLGLLRRRGQDHASLIGVEAQAVSHGLARRSVEANGLGAVVSMRHGDLRSLDAVVDPAERFDLITGSPPYFPEGTALPSPHPQRAACRMELRGSVLDYAAAAAPRLAPGGRFVFVMTARDPRTEQAPADAGLAVLDRLDVVFRRGEDPMVAVLTCARREDAPEGGRHARTLVIREADGALSQDYRAIRVALGFGDAAR